MEGLLVDGAGVVHLVSVGHDWSREAIGGVWYGWWDPALRRWNLWGYIDARDGAQAVDQGLYLPARLLQPQAQPVHDHSGL